MPRIPYSLNSYTGGAIPATLFYSVTATGTAITITGTNTTWSGLGVNGGFNLAINYGGVNEEKVFVPSGTYPWTSGGVTLSGITRGYDNTTPYLQVAGLSVVPVLTAIETAEANQLVNVVLANLNTSTSGQLLTSTGSGIAFTPNLLSTPKSLLTNPILNGTMETIYNSTSGAAGLMTVDVTSGSTYFYSGAASNSFFFNITASGGLSNLVGPGQSFTASVLVNQTASGYPPVTSGMRIDNALLVPNTGTSPFYWYGGTAPSSGYPNGIDAYTFNIINTGSTNAISGSLTSFNFPDAINFMTVSGTAYAIVGNAGNSTVSVINTLNNNGVVAVISGASTGLSAGVGFYNQLALSISGASTQPVMYIPNNVSNAISQIVPSGNTFVGLTTVFSGTPTYKLGQVNELVAAPITSGTVTSSGIYAYSKNIATISVLNVSSGTYFSSISGTSLPANTGNTGNMMTVGTTVSGTFVYAVSDTTNTVNVINTSGTNGPVLVTTLSGAQYNFNSPNGLALVATASGNFLYCASYSNNSVTVINANTNTYVMTISGNGLWYPGYITASGTNLYVLSRNQNPLSTGYYSIAVINANTNTVSTVISGQNLGQPIASALTPDGSKLYLGNQVTNSVTVFNTATNSGTAIPNFVTLASQTRY